MKMPKDDLDSNSEVEILQGILSELQDLNASIARIDERSQQNRTSVNKLREDRIVPVERQADKTRQRSKRNSLILGAGLTILTILIGAGLTHWFSLI